jgi:Holliday junction resolvasome RuvABC endonuclease subunit
MKILGLDISISSTGYCIFNNGKLMKKSCGLIQPNPKETYGQRLLFLEKEIKKVIKKNKPDEVVIEDIYKGRNAKTFKILSMARGVVIKTIYEETGKDPISVMASSARSLVGIKNKKEIAYEFIVKKYKLKDYEFNKHNDIVDAIVLALSAHTMKKQGLNEKSI